jgi:hypothetical protein
MYVVLRFTVFKVDENIFVFKTQKETRGVVTHGRRIGSWLGWI